MTSALEHRLSHPQPHTLPDAAPLHLPLPLRERPPAGEVVGRNLPVVLIVGGTFARRHVLSAALAELHVQTRKAGGVAEALDLIHGEEPDLVVVDSILSDGEGIELCRRLRADDVGLLTPIVLIDPRDRRDVRMESIVAGADALVAGPLAAHELALRCAALLERRRHSVRLDVANAAETFSAISAVRDPLGAGHGERVGALAGRLGRAIGIADEGDLDTIRWGGILHDVGKSVVPDELLRKDGPLTSEDWDVMRCHSLNGESLCRPLRGAGVCLPIVRHHHERWDGHGYPDGLAGHAIPLGARIVAVADAWDAMTTDRAYRIGITPEEAAQRLRQGAGTQWDPELVATFLSLDRRTPTTG